MFEQTFSIFDSPVALKNINNMMFEISASKKLSSDKLTNLVKIAGFLAPTNLPLWQNIGKTIE
jgi:hypothetical protein